MPEPVKRAVREGQRGEFLTMAEGKLRKFQQHFREFHLLAAAGSGVPGAGEETVLDRGGNSFRRAGGKRLAAQVARWLAISRAFRSRLRRGATLERVKHLLFEIAAVVIGDLGIGNRRDDV